MNSNNESVRLLRTASHATRVCRRGHSLFNGYATRRTD